jgi:cytochrome c556
MKNLSRTLIVVVIVVLAFGAAYAQFAKPEAAIEYRKSVMTLIGHHFGLMAAVIKGQNPYDKAEFERNAQLVQTLSTLPWEAFMTAGTDKGDTSLKSSALKDQSGFAAAAKAFENEAVKLVDTAAGGDLNAIKSQFGAVAQSCKNCHGQYRK